MRKRDTIRNINKLTSLMDAEMLIGYSSYRGYAVPCTIRPIKFENCLDGVRTYSYHGYLTQKIVKNVYLSKKIQTIYERGTIVSLTARMIKYLLKIAVIVDAENKLSFNLDAYKMWCEKYNLPISEKVTSL